MTDAIATVPRSLPREDLESLATHLGYTVEETAELYDEIIARSALPSPSGLEVVAWRWPAPHVKGGALHSVTNVEPPCSGWEPLVRLSDAQSLLSSQAQEIDEAWGAFADVPRDKPLSVHITNALDELAGIADQERSRAEAAEQQVQRLMEALEIAAGRLAWAAQANPGVRDDFGKGLAMDWANEARQALNQEAGR